MKVKKIFSADDWGFSPGINEGILALARQNRLYSVSCSANAPYLLHGLRDLLRFAESGLKFHIHFNLTYGGPLTRCPTLTNENGKFFDFNKFVLKGFAGHFARTEILQEFKAQLENLRRNNVPVKGLDGHHHIHLLSFVYNSIKKNLTECEISSVRIMSDIQHPASFFSSFLFKNLLFREEKFISLNECGYLLPHNLVSIRRLQNKLEKFQQLIVHPARFNDFAECGMHDVLQDQRVKELKCIEEFYRE